ncbi:MAG: hypothetical protein GXX91_03585 [Verrucomicrobiaceae bacterium]|nr:hypothetical protein [Verrucomicrobiaceae bacterium]
MSEKQAGIPERGRQAGYHAIESTTSQAFTLHSGAQSEPKSEFYSTFPEFTIFFRGIAQKGNFPNSLSLRIACPSARVPAHVNSLSLGEEEK